MKLETHNYVGGMSTHANPHGSAMMWVLWARTWLVTCFGFLLLFSHRMVYTETILFSFFVCMCVCLRVQSTKIVSRYPLDGFSERDEIWQFARWGPCCTPGPRLVNFGPWGPSSAPKY